MSIKFRILLTVVLLQVLGFAALLLNYNQRAHVAVVASHLHLLAHFDDGRDVLPRASTEHAL